MTQRRGKGRRYRNPKGITPNYPDTAKGALAYLANDSTLNLTNATAIPDPQVDGVWKVTTPADTDVEFAIVYLAGYRDPFGQYRELDDFECCHRDAEGDR